MEGNVVHSQEVGALLHEGVFWLGQDADRSLPEREALGVEPGEGGREGGV